tara:strand:+ start:71914 stop:73452 length:1539 start_codon:yes stop_codon:yes gene_type:complete
MRNIKRNEQLAFWLAMLINYVAIILFAFFDFGDTSYRILNFFYLGLVSVTVLNLFKSKCIFRKLFHFEKIFFFSLLILVFIPHLLLEGIEINILIGLPFLLLLIIITWILPRLLLTTFYRLFTRRSEKQYTIIVLFSFSILFLIAQLSGVNKNLYINKLKVKKLLHTKSNIKTINEVCANEKFDAGVVDFKENLILIDHDMKYEFIYPRSYKNDELKGKSFLQKSSFEVIDCVFSYGKKIYTLSDSIQKYYIYEESLFNAVKIVSSFNYLVEEAIKEKNIKKFTYLSEQSLNKSISKKNLRSLVSSLEYLDFIVALTKSDFENFLYNLNDVLKESGLSNNEKKVIYREIQKHIKEEHLKAFLYMYIGSGVMKLSRVEELIDLNQLSFRDYELSLNFIQNIRTFKSFRKAIDLFLKYEGDIQLFAFKGNHKVIKDVTELDYLIEKGFDVNNRDESGNTMLMHFLQYNKYTLAKHIVKKGADVELLNSSGYNANEMDICKKDKEKCKRKIRFLK